MITDRKFFHKGNEMNELANDLDFPSNGKNLTCYTESLDGKISLVLDPILNYISQVDELKSDDSADHSQMLKDMISLLYALENNARLTLEKWLDDFEKHLGSPSVRYL